jgi:hypothetical protein
MKSADNMFDKHRSCEGMTMGWFSCALKFKI